MFATVMVFRHIIAILLSCVLFFHPLTMWQWMAGVVVLGTYYFHSVNKKRGGKKGGEEKGEEMREVVVEGDQK